MKNLFIITLIVLFIILFILYLIDYFKKPKMKEGFDSGDVTKVVNKIEDVVKIAGQIPAKLNSIDDRIISRVSGQITSITSKLERDINGTMNTAKSSIENTVLDKIDGLTDTLQNNLEDGMNTAKSSIENTVLKRIESLTDTLQNKLEDGLNTAKNEIEDNVIGKVAELGDQIEKNMLSKLDDLGNNIKKFTVDLVTNKFVSFFKQLGDIFDNGLIKPFGALFEGLGNIFVQLFGILKLIGYKITSLPGCTVIYAIQSTIDVIFGIYNMIMPSFLKPVLSILYRYTIGLVFYFIGYITGYTDAVERCYGFNVDEELDKMNKNAGDIRKAFVKSWGLDFSKIKI